MMEKIILALAIALSLSWSMQLKPSSRSVVMEISRPVAILAIDVA